MRGGRWVRGRGSGANQTVYLVGGNDGSNNDCSLPYSSKVVQNACEASGTPAGAVIPALVVFPSPITVVFSGLVREVEVPNSNNDDSEGGSLIASIVG